MATATYGGKEFKERTESGEANGPCFRQHFIQASFQPPPPPHLDAPGQRRGQLPSSVWTRHRAVKQGQSGGCVGTTCQGKGRGEVLFDALAVERFMVCEVHYPFCASSLSEVAGEKEAQKWHTTWRMPHFQPLLCVPLWKHFHQET